MRPPRINYTVCKTQIIGVPTILRRVVLQLRAAPSTRTVLGAIEHATVSLLQHTSASSPSSYMCKTISLYIHTLIHRHSSVRTVTGAGARSEDAIVSVMISGQQDHSIMPPLSIFNNAGMTVVLAPKRHRPTPPEIWRWHRGLLAEYPRQPCCIPARVVAALLTFQSRRLELIMPPRLRRHGVLDDACYDGRGSTF